MGKRELLLIVGFVIFGAVVYQATAPEAGPGEKGLSISRLIEAARREVRGNRATAEVTTTATHPIAPEVSEIRLSGPIAELEITGEPRTDVESTIAVHSNGYDEAEAKEYVRQSKLLTDTTASALILKMDYPQGGRQRGTVRLKVPARIHVRLEAGSGAVVVKGVASAEIAGLRGDATIQQIAGRVEIGQRGGELKIDDVGRLEVNGRAGVLKVRGVRGDTTLKVDGGEITASALTGGVELDCRNISGTVEGLDATRGPIRVIMNGGQLSLKGLRSEARIESRNADLSVAMAAAAPVEIYNEGANVTFTPPPGGFTLDAVLVGGRVTPAAALDELRLQTSRSGENELRAAGAVRGGGATVTVRSTHGDLVLRAPAPEAAPGGRTADDEKDPPR